MRRSIAAVKFTKRATYDDDESRAERMRAPGRVRHRERNGPLASRRASTSSRWSPTRDRRSSRLSSYPWWRLCLRMNLWLRYPIPRTGRASADTRAAPYASTAATYPTATAARTARTARSRAATARAA